jgi:hypothetical protein
MNKRKFLSSAALAGLLPTLSVEAAAGTVSAAAKSSTGLLTISGTLAKGNRGPLDPALDQMMAKQGIQFTKAWVFDAAALYRLPAVTIQPTLEYDAKVHRLSGPLITTVLKAAGVDIDSALQLGLRAVDGYNIWMSLADVRSTRMLVATHIDGQPLAIGGLGPQWAVYDADRLPQFKDKPLKERFSLCPWGLYHIDVKPA